MRRGGERRPAKRGGSVQVEAQTGFSTLLPVGPVRLGGRAGKHIPPGLVFIAHLLPNALQGAGFRLAHIIRPIITQRWREPQSEGGARMQKRWRRDPCEGERSIMDLN